MEVKLTKKLADELMKVEGETRGFNLRDDAHWIKKIKGEEAVKKVEEETKKVGYPINYEKIKKTNFYPAGFRAISLLAIKKALEMDDGDIKKTCAFHPKISFIVRLFAKHFYSVPQALKKSQEIWKKYWTSGELKEIDYNAEEKSCRLRLTGLDLHPIFCVCMEGYLVGLTQMVTGSDNVTCEETECSFRGGKYHDYVLRW